MEALAAAAILRERTPDLKLRFVNVVDLFKLQPASEHPHGSTEREFDSLFTTDKPIIFNFHGYPWLIHKLSYRFKGHENMHVRGYKEKGNINTPLELAMLNETSRFHLVIDVIDRVPKLRTKAAHLKEAMKNAIIDNLHYAHEQGTDLKDNPLLKEPLKTEDVKHRLLGHWGASPALSFVWIHLNRMIVKHDLDVIFVAGPGHGAPGVLGPAYLEGTYSEIYPDKSEDAEGMQKFFKQFSFPGHIGSHVTPETPGSIHEGGELGYSLSHAYGMALDNPDLIVACVVGDGEAETGPLATAWHSNKFINPVRDGAVLPILNLNGYKIANPTILSRVSHEELEALFVGYGYKPYFVEGDDPTAMHQKMAATLEEAIGEIRAQQKMARQSNNPFRPRWPMIVLRSPKGWTGPKEIRGHKVEGSWRAHQVPFSDVRDNPANLKLLEDWMRSYKPEELFDANGKLVPELKALAPKGNRRMSANPHANGGLLRKELKLPDFRKYAVEVSTRGTTQYENTKPLGEFLRDVMKNNMTSFRVFGPDETASNRLQAIYEVSKKTWMADLLPEDADGGELSRDGRVMEMLSEHTLIGWLEGYLLTGRHGFFHTYEAFAHVIDSMFNQHAKWLDIC